MTNQKWEIIYYKTPQGRSPVSEFINSLEVNAKSKIIDTFDLLTEFGIKLGAPHAKKLSGTELWELRILGSDSLRIFYISVSGKKFLLLHGFKKKTQKTDIKEIKTAVKRFQDYKIRQN